jgi:alpha-tubulin suppressor-like RCC1 family protein
MCSIKIVCGNYHSAGIRLNGEICIWGDFDFYAVDINGKRYSKKDNLPIGKFIQIASGPTYIVGIRDDNTIWVSDNYHLKKELLSQHFIKIACGNYHTIAIKKDGTLSTLNIIKETNILPPGQFIKIACGYHHSIGIRDDGNIIAWTNNKPWYNDRIDKSPPITDLLEEKFVKIACGDYFSIGLRKNGSIVTWTEHNNLNKEMDDSPLDKIMI